MTPHALWKSMCRMMESKPFVQRFGPGVLHELGKHAIFEISEEQVSQLEMKIDMRGDPQMSLPFPKIAMIFPDFILAIEQPEMNVDTEVFEYRATFFYPHSGTAPAQEVAFAKIRFDMAASRIQNKIVIDGDEYRSHLQWEGGNTYDYPALPGDQSKLTALRDRFETVDFATDEERERGFAALRGLEEAHNRHDIDIASYMRTTFDISLRVIAWINQPKHYIVERGPEVVRKPSMKDKDREPRLAERARYIILNHEDVKRRWTAAQGTHASPMPHLRRRHCKTLRSERYGNNRGKVIWVSACHVGGECVEWRNGDVRYKVIG